MNKEGFTLIELLGIIAILAIIALIVYPIIDDLIDRQEQNAFKLSVEGIYKAVGIDYADRGFSSSLKYKFEGKKLTLIEKNGEELLASEQEDIRLTGEIVDGDGEIVVDNDGNIIIEIQNEYWCAYNEQDESSGQYYSTIKVKDGICN